MRASGPIRKLAVVKVVANWLSIFAMLTAYWRHIDRLLSRIDVKMEVATQRRDPLHENDLIKCPLIV